MADLNIDSLQLQIEADSNEANESLDTLSASLKNLSRSLDNVGRHANDISKIGHAFTSMQNFKMPNLQSFITQLETMSHIDLKNIDSKKINLDIRITGASEAERMKYAIEDAVNNTKIDTKRISKQLTDAFRLDPSVAKEVKATLESMAEDIANGGGASKQLNDLFLTLSNAGNISRGEFEKMFSSVGDDLIQEYQEFLEYVRKHPISTSELDAKNGFKGAASEWNEDIVKGGLGAYFRKNGTKLDTGYFEELIHLFPTVMSGYRGLVDGQSRVESGANSMKDAMKDALRAAQDYLKGSVSPTDNDNASANSVGLAYQKISKRIEEEKNKAMRESATKIPMDFNIDENRLLKQVENAVKTISKHDFGKIDLKLDVDTTSLTKNFFKAFDVSGFNGLALVADDIRNIKDVMGEFSGIDIRKTGIPQFTGALASLSRNSKNLDVSVFTKVADGLQELEKASSVAGLAETFGSFLRGVNSFIRSSEKMKDAANTFPTLALEIQEFFSELANIDISDRTLRMAEAFAEIAKNGKKAGSSLQSMERATQKTGAEITRATMIMNGFSRATSWLESIFRRLGGATLNGIKNLVSQIGQLGKHSSSVGTLTGNIKTLLGTMIGFRGIQGLFNWTKEMVKMGADVTEIDHIVESVFGDMAGYVDKWATQAIDKFGIAATAAKQYAGTLSAMFQASNIGIKDSGKMALDLVELAGDLSAFYNIDTEDAYRKIQSGMAGMVRPLRSLGIDLSVASLKEFALSQGIEKSYTEMTQAEKVMLRYQYLMQNTTNQQGDFERTSLSLANSMRILRAYVSEITTQLGVGFGAAIRHVVVWLNSLMSVVLKASQAFATFMQTLFGKYKGGASGAALGDYYGLDDSADSADALADGADDAADGLGDAADNAEKLKKELSVLPFDELNQLNKDQEKSSSSNGKGSGGSGGGIGGLGDFGDGLIDWGEKELDGALGDLEEKLSAWAKRIKGFAKADNWYQVGGEIARGFNKGLKELYELLNPDKVDEYVMPWVKRFSDAVNGFVDYLDFDMLGRVIGRGINDIVKIFNGFVDPETGIDFKNIGKKLADGANGLVDEINWTQLGEFFGNKFMVLWNTLYGFATEFKWDEFGKHLGEGINAFNGSVDLSVVLDSLVESLNGVFDSLRNFTQTVNWDDIAGNIADGINTAIGNFKWKENGQALNNFIQKLLETITKIARKTDWTALGEGIGTALSEIDWFKALSEVAVSIVSALGGLLAGMAKTPAGIFLEAFGSALVVGKIAIALDTFTAGIGTFLSGAQSVGIVTAGFQGLMGASGIAGITAALAGLAPVLLPVAAVLGIALLGAIWGNTAEGKAEMARCQTAFQTDVKNGLHGVETAFYGTGYSIEQKQKDTADSIIADNKRWVDDLIWYVIPEYVKANGEAAGSVASLRQAVYQNDDEMIAKLEEWGRAHTQYTGQIITDNTGVDDSVRTTTNHWGECYDLVLGHLQTLAENHDTQLQIMEDKISEFETAVETGLSNSGNSWKTLEQDEQGHSESLIQSLQDQIDKVHEWEENLTILARAGVDEGFLNELARMGTDGAPLVESAVSQISTEGGLAELNQTWQDLINAQGMMDDVGKTLKEAGITNIQEAFGDLSKNVEDEQKNVNEGIARGQEMYAPLAKDAMEKTASDMFGAMREFNKTGSPSQTYEDESKNIIDGLVQGIDRNEPDIFTSMRNMATGMMDAFKETIDIGGMIDNAFSDISYICSTVEGYGSDIATSLANGLSGVTIPSIEVVVEYQWLDMGDGTSMEIPSYIYPKFHYYAKGALFTDAAIFGEAGDEAALPLENNKVMKRVASAIVNSGGLGLDDSSLSSAVARGYVQAMMANQGNERPIDVYATLYTEDNEVLARAVSRGQQSIDYRNNPTTQLSY